MEEIRQPQEKYPVFTLILIFFTMLPVTMIVPVFKDLIKDRLGGDNLMVSFFMSSAMLGSFLFSPVAGFLSDKFRNRKTFISIFAILDGLCFFLLSRISSLNLLQGVRFIEGVCHVFVIGLLLSLISDRENDPSSKRFFKKGLLLGVSGSLLSLGVGIGSPLGVFGRKDPLLPFYIAGTLMLLIGFLSIFFLKDHPFHFQAPVTLRNWYRAFKKNVFILLPYAYTFIDRFSVGFLVTTFNLHLREDLHLKPGEVGLSLSLVLIPMSLLSYPFALVSKKTGTLPLMMLGSVLYGLCIGFAGFAEEKIWLWFWLLLAGLGAGVMFVPSMIFCSSIAPEGYNASVMAGFTGFGSIGFMLGPIVAGLIEPGFIERFGKSNGFSLLSLLIGSMEIGIVILSIPFYNTFKGKKNE